MNLLLIPGKLVNKTPCLYLCSFPFVVAALLLVGRLASLAWILTYPTVMIQIQTRSLIHQFSRYIEECRSLSMKQTRGLVRNTGTGISV